MAVIHFGVFRALLRSRCRPFEAKVIWENVIILLFHWVTNLHHCRPLFIGRGTRLPSSKGSAGYS